VNEESYNQIIQLWEGKEDLMIASLVDKYKKIIPPHMMLHLDQLHSILESQTDSSFVTQN
jgi:hypothetical protein